MRLVSAKEQACVVFRLIASTTILLVEVFLLAVFNLKNKCMEDLLNPYQKNSLRITLLGFEESLRHALEWLDGYEEDGILYSCRLSLPEENKKQIRQAINVALGLIEKLNHKFDLQKESNNVASMLRGELSVNWANLLDTRAKKLVRYGDVHPKLANILDSDIQNLAEIALQLSALLGESQQE